MPKNYTLRFLLFIILFLSGPIHSLAQTNNEQKGMETKPKNYTSFSPREIQHIEEWKKHNLPEYYGHPDFGKLAKDAPCQECVEDLSKRNADERYFIDIENPGKFYQQKALGDLHGELNGDWVTIDQALYPASNGVYESGFAQEQAGFDLTQHKVYIKTVGGTVYFNNWSAHIVANGEASSLGDFSWDNYSVGEDGVYITEAFPGIDAEMIVFRGAIKTNFILKSNEFGVFDYLVFRDQFTSPETSSMQFDSGEGTQGVGSFSLFSGNSNLLHIGEAVLFAKDGPKELVQAGEYVLNGNTMDVRVPFNWINENIESYHLIVDPLVTGSATLAQASITGSRYNASCNFTNSCDYTLTVPSPAGATLTNVAFTFTYTANGSTCWLQDGATRISLGACTSPSMAGYYWFCNAIGGGTCAANNQTVWSDLAGCMPSTPSCASQNLTFTLKFYRSCWGASGCSNACIGAGTPWTMTITGQTLAYVNTATPITLSATTVCAGGSITASAPVQYGVPAYSYNWSFSPTGLPSIGTGSSTSITFPTSGSVTLYSIVTDACGNQVTSSRVITVTPGPTITVNSPAICAGSSATLTASGGTTYTWTPTATLSSGTGTSVTATPATTTTYTVVGTTSGCSGTTTSTVTVNPLPVISVNSPTICIGGNATLTASGATSYTWTPTATLSSGTGTSVTATPAATTTYTVTGTTGTCTGTATATVTVVPQPVISVNSQTICAGSSATLTASGATSYTWTPAATLSSGTGTSVTATPATTTTYTVIGTTGTCSGTTTATVTVDPNPIVTVNSPAICAGSSATLTASGATSYTWTPTTTLSSGTGASVTATPATTTTYMVTGTTGTCTGTATATVTVNPNPVVSVNSPTICAGGTATLTASGATSYTWTPTATLSSGTGTTVTASPAATTTYTIVGTTGTCTGTTTSTVTVNPNPVIAVNSPAICAGASATLTASGGTTYTWTPTATLSSGTGTSVTATPATTTTYTVTGTTGTCSGTATSTVTVNPNPVITVLNPTICAGGSATLNAAGATTYTWTPSATLSSGTGTSVVATPATTTTYTIVGTTGTCTGTTTSTVTVNPIPVISVNNPTICEGASATVIPTGAGYYSWTPSSTLSSSVGSPVIATPATTTTYTITGTNGGCTSTTTATVTVIPNPVVTVNSPTICAGASDILTASGATSYTWTPSATLSSGTGTSVTATPATTTTYTVTGTTGTCIGTATATVTVNPIPVIAVNSPALCAGSSTTLTASGATSYTWTPAATLSSGTGTSVTATPAATTTYTVTGTTLGCSGTANSTVTVNPIPTISASNNGPLCPGQTLILTGNGQVGGAYSWSGPNSFSDAAQNPQIANVSSANEGTYTVTVTLNGCTNSTTTTFALSPNIPSTINSNGPYCQNDPVTILSAVNPGGTWSGTGITNPATGAFDPSLAALGNNTITYQIAGSCNTSSTATVVVNGLPNPTFTSNVTDGCAPLNVQFTNTTAGSSSVQWDLGNGNTTSQINPSTVYNNVGCYPVSLAVTDANGCSNAVTMNSFICVLTSPNAQFMVGNAVAAVSNPVFQFVNSSTDAISYLWNFGDGTSNTIFSPSHTYDETAGSYLVQLVAYNAAGCSDTAHVIVTVKDEQIFYVPNAFTPNGDESNNTFEPVFTSGVDESNFSLIIFNRWGETLFETKDPKVGWDGTYHGQIVPAGSYVWALRFKDPKSDDKFEFSGNVSVNY
jgi:gliding motility-associated-like protein